MIEIHDPVMRDVVDRLEFLWAGDVVSDAAYKDLRLLIDAYTRAQQWTGPGTCGDTFRCDDGTRFVCDRIAGHGLHRGDGHLWTKDHAEVKPDMKTEEGQR